MPLLIPKHWQFSWFVIRTKTKYLKLQKVKLEKKLHNLVADYTIVPYLLLQMFKQSVQKRIKVLVEVE